MNQTTHYNPPSPIPYLFPSVSHTKSNLHHLEVGGMQVELRYKSGAPSLQQKVIQFCNQSLQN